MLLPHSIQIQTIDYCNRRCAWCPNSTMDKSPDALIPMDVFEKILGDLKAEGYKGKIHLYLMGEPLCDPRITDLIAITRRMLPENVVFLSTNGDALNGPESAQRLIDAGLTWLVISDYDDKGRFEAHKTIPGVSVATLAELAPTYYNRGGNIDVPCVKPFPNCNWVSQKAYVNYRGDVILCCSDYHYSVVFGNVMDRPFGEIYNGEEYRQYRKAHALRRGKEMPLCKECNRIA